VTLFVAPTLPKITAAYGIVWTISNRLAARIPARSSDAKLREPYWEQAGRHI
jgi:hypothetical protein